MEPATGSERKYGQQQHVPPCEVGEVSKEQQAVIARCWEQQDVKSKSARKGSELVYSAEQRRALELLAEEKCPIAERDG